MSTFWKAIAIVGIVLLAGILALQAVQVFADTDAYTLTGAINVVEGQNPALGFFADALCTVPIGLDIPMFDAPQNGQSETSIYVQNIGNVDYSNIAVSTGTTPGFSVAAQPTDFPLAQGESQELVITASIPADFPLSQVPYTVIVHGDY